MLRLAVPSILRYFTNFLELEKGIDNLWTVRICLYLNFLLRYLHDRRFWFSSFSYYLENRPKEVYYW